MSSDMIVLLTAIFTATACSLVGTFLVLRRMAMMADAISHAILPGLVFAYFLANGPNLIAGTLGAALAGVATVVLVEALQRSGKVKTDSAIGIVFPALFAFGTFLVSRYFANVHLDADAVLFGEIAFAPFDRLLIAGQDIGSQPLIVLAALSVLNLLLVLLFFKELKLATFDPGLAAALGLSPVVVHYGLMTTVSLTTVGSFAAVGAILVVAMMIVPAATAYLLTDRLDLMIALSVGSGIASAVIGYYVAVALDVSISGMMAVTAGIIFAVSALASPSHGIIAKALRRARNREQFAIDLVLLHLAHHERGAETFGSAMRELQWPEGRLRHILAHAIERGLIDESNGVISLTDGGRLAAERRDRSIGYRALDSGTASLVQA